MRNLMMACGAALLLLSGCTTPQQRAANMQAEMEQMIQVYGPACTRLGYAANSDQWRGCVLQLSAKDDAQRYGNQHYYATFGRPYWAWGGYWGPYW